MKIIRPVYLLSFLLTCIVLGIILSFSDMLSLHLWINGFHNSFLDGLMPILTILGDGIFILSLAVIFLLFCDKAKGWLIVLSYIVSALLTQSLKHLVFAESMRPFYFFKNDPNFYSIKGFLYFEFNSFPSGHATSIFALITVLVCFYGNSIWKQMAFFLFACLLAFSRVYLSQHFLIDILFGSIIGVSTSLLLISFYPNKCFTNHLPYLNKWIARK